MAEILQGLRYNLRRAESCIVIDRDNHLPCRQPGALVSASDISERFGKRMEFGRWKLAMDHIARSVVRSIVQNQHFRTRCLLECGANRCLELGLSVPGCNDN